LIPSENFAGTYGIGSLVDPALFQLRWLITVSVSAREVKEKFVNLDIDE
jgi:hypothetical protein